ncbi:MAG: Gfo/Idh/MocA family oxidoreductase [Betaproteobacteria bacterium]|nr:Gfo/Idh/MocA family oxidoreductase [Betaproteobacteria bacterium]
MGRYHAEKFAALRGAKLVAVVDADSARASALASKLDTEPLINHRELFGKVDAAVVAVPTDRHHAVARECLQQGMHLLIEKPIATTLAEADELIELAARKQLVLQTGHVERYNKAFRALAKRMERPIFIESERLAAFKQRGAEVDVVLDLMIHDLDLACSLARAEPSNVSALGFRVVTNDIDIANARIEFENGCVASLSASRVSQTAVRKLRVFQPGLYVSADLQAGKLRYVRSAKGEIEQIDETHPGGDALADQAAAFATAVRKNSAAEIDGSQGRRALELALTVGRLVRERLQKFA